MKNPTAPTGGEYGTAPGVWTLEQAMNYQRAGTWPTPVTTKYLWQFGDGTSGALGFNNTNKVYLPTALDSNGWKSTDTGDNWQVAVRQTGTMWSWGENNSTGRLGLGDTTKRSSPVQIGSATNWSFVTVGNNHGLALTTSNVLWGWGSNNAGQLGQNNTYSRSSPVQISTSVSSVAGSSNSTAFIKTNGTLWTCGQNTNGELGIGLAGNQYSGSWRSSPVQVGALTTWSKVYSFDGAFGALTTGNAIWVWGINSYGQLGQNNTVNRSSPVQVGALTTWSKLNSCGNGGAAIKNDGTLWVWGVNYSGKLGDSSTVNKSSPVQVGTDTNWASCVGGQNTTSALKTDGTFWTWGKMDNGYSGYGPTNMSASSPVQVGQNITWTKLKTGVTGKNIPAFGRPKNPQLWMWGSGSFGKLGKNNTTSYSSPVQVGANTNWAYISTGASVNSHTLATKTDGTLWAWGKNNAGQLGQGDTIARSSPTQVGALTTWRSVSVGQYFSVVEKVGPGTGNTLWAFGENYYGTLGDGTRSNRYSPVLVLNSYNSGTPSCGKFHTTASFNGRVNSWGRNNAGQLGDNTRNSRSQPVQTYGTPVDARWVVAANFATAAVTNSGKLYTWGDGGQGKLASNATASRSVPAQVGSLTNWGRWISGGYRAFAAVKQDGTMWAWGENYATLGDGTSSDKSSPVQIGSGRTWRKVCMNGQGGLAISTAGTLWAWGTNGDGTVGNNSTTKVYSPILISSATTWISLGGGTNSASATKATNT